MRTPFEDTLYAHVLHLFLLNVLSVDLKIWYLLTRSWHTSCIVSIKWEKESYITELGTNYLEHLKKENYTNYRYNMYVFLNFGFYLLYSIYNIYMKIII